MKKHILALVLVLAFVMAFSSACHTNQNNGPTEIEIPTPEPTKAPEAIDPNEIDACFGDWYGIYSVTAASGAYAANAGVRNDCAMRVSLDSFGRGSCCLVVNGLGTDSISGSTNIFALCTAELAEGSLNVKGMVNRFPVSWSFTADNGVLRLKERYGDDTDNMEIEIVLARPDALAASGLRPDAMDYVTVNGFGGIVALMGGNERELPALTPMDGYDAHDFFSKEGELPLEDPIPEGEHVVSANGRITLNLPDGFVVLENDALGFIVACPEDSLWSVDLSSTTWSTDALSYLVSITPDLGELYHFTIDGFDFYGAFTGAENGTVTFRLCGVRDGRLVMINMLMGMDQTAAKEYVNGEHFRQLILGAKFGE